MTHLKWVALGLVLAGLGQGQQHQPCPVGQMDCALEVELGNIHQQACWPHSIHYCCLNVWLPAHSILMPCMAMKV